MYFAFKTHICLVLLMVAASLTQGFASPRRDQALRLVPKGAEIVAGIEDPQNENSHGRLLFITHNNNLDLTDCLALTGVDSHRQVSQLIEVAASSDRGELQEHLLLAAGRFDREHVFRAGIANGAATIVYDGIAVLVIKPFAREVREMKDNRWMAFPDKETLVFGSPALVSKALDRYISGAPVDAELANRLGQLRPDVNSWDVLTMSSTMLQRHVAPGQSGAPWTHILDRTDELTMGIHYGSTARIDFVFHASHARDSGAIAEYLDHREMAIACVSKKCGLPMRSVSSSAENVFASTLIPGEQFDQWLEAIVRNGTSAPGH